MSTALLPGGLTKRKAGDKVVYQDANGQPVTAKDAEAAIKAAEKSGGK